MRIEIPLQFNRKDFEEIYFRDNNGNYFKSDVTKKSFLVFILSIVFFILISVYIYISEKDMLALIYPLLLPIIAFLVFMEKAYGIRVWKKAVKKYLDSIEPIQLHKIILTEKKFSLIQDEEETIESWSNFTTVEIKVDYIDLNGIENFFFPRKSMSEEDFLKLKEVISEKVKGE